MKVCILSMQRVPNFGSLLQSYSLKRMLEGLGCEVHFIDIQPDPHSDQMVNCTRHDYKAEHEPRGFISKLKKIDKYAVNRFRIKTRDKVQAALFEQFRRDYLGICNSDNEKPYDLCVIGSDEVFNCLTPSRWGFTTQLFGDVKQSRRVITYAASCGATTIDQINDAMREAIRDSFCRISGFSARDINTGRFISALTDSPVEYHLDPVLVADFDDEVDSTEITAHLPKRYCVVYSYYNRIHQEQEIEAILSFCREKDLTPVAVGAPQMWLRDYVVVSPFEALKIIQGAQFVITDTFHGTIFAEKYNGNYAVMIRASNENKLQDLIERLNLHEHVIRNFSELNEAYNRKLQKLAQERIVKERTRSVEYLKNHVQCNI